MCLYIMYFRAFWFVFVLLRLCFPFSSLSRAVLIFSGDKQSSLPFLTISSSLFFSSSFNIILRLYVHCVLCISSILPFYSFLFPHSPSSALPTPIFSSSFFISILLLPFTSFIASLFSSLLLCFLSSSPFPLPLLQNF